MKKILKNSNGNAVSTNGKLFTVSANYTDQIKQALIDKGVATEATPSSELAGKIEGISPLKTLLDKTKSCVKLFYNYTGTSVDDLIKYDDTENVTDISEMFRYCSNLQNIPLLNMSKVTKMNSTYESCEKIQTISVNDTSNIKEMNNTFANCYNLQNDIVLDCSKLTQLYMIFSSCRKIKNVTFKNTQSCRRMVSLFYICRELETVGVIDMISMTSTSNPFYGCGKLTNLTLLNIKTNIEIGRGNGSDTANHGGYLLTLDSLVNTIKELVNTGSSKTLTMGSANLEKIANVYVRRTTEGDVPTCLSDNSNIDLAKAPCEICESTDEGAMLITAYANSKNWTLA